MGNGGEEKQFFGGVFIRRGIDDIYTEEVLATKQALYLARKKFAGSFSLSSDRSVGDKEKEEKIAEFDGLVSVWTHEGVLKNSELSKPDKSGYRNYRGLVAKKDSIGWKLKLKNKHLSMSDENFGVLLTLVFNQGQAMTKEDIFRWTKVSSHFSFHQKELLRNTNVFSGWERTLIDFNLLLKKRGGGAKVKSSWKWIGGGEKVE